MSSARLNLEQLFSASKDGRRMGDSERLVVWVGDRWHAGTDIYWCHRLEQWVFVDLENRRMVEVADRIAVYESSRDGDEIGLNHAEIYACDFDQPRGVWVVGLDDGDDPTPEREDIDLVWTDCEKEQ